MKIKISALVCLLFIATITTNAQNNESGKKFFQQVQGGMIVATFAGTAFEGNQKPFSVDNLLLANIAIITPKTYHNFNYNFAGNSVVFVNGYILPKDLDIYTVYGKGLSDDHQYLALAIEKMLKAGSANCFLTCELGTDLKGRKFLSFGVLLSVQRTFWKRK